MTTMRNSVQLIGHAGKDPEVKTILNDRKMARFSLATNDYYTNNKGERVEQTHWHQITAWGKLAEIVEKEVAKGKQILVSGKLSTNNWEDKDGNKRQAVEVVVEDFNFVGGGRGGDSGAERSAPSSKSTTNSKDVVIEDIDDKPIDLSEIPF